VMFAIGVLPNTPEGIYMTDSRYGYMMTWVAKKGHADDWAVYCYWYTQDVEWVKQHGDKIHTEKYIRRCVPCDDLMFSKYRY